MSACLVLLGMLVGCAAPSAAPGLAPPTEDRWVAEDKVQHFAMSFATTGMAYGGGRLVLDAEPARIAAASLAVTLGVGKELVDARSGGPFSLKDLVWDAAGVALGYILAQRID